MWPLIGGLISGGASLLGNMFSSNTSAQNTQAQIQAQQQMQQETEQFNAGQAQIGRDYNTQMSNTAYQRASADMKAAGLNPMMMFGSGSAASTPSSPTASVGTPSVPMPTRTSPFANLGDAASKVISSAISVKTFDKMTDEIAKLEAERANLQASTGLRSQETKTEEQETLRRANEVNLTALKLPGARFSAKQAEDLESLPDWLRSAAVKGGWLGDKASDVIAPIGSTAKGLLGLRPKRSTSETTTDDGRSSFTERFHYQ